MKHQMYDFLLKERFDREMAEYERDLNSSPIIKGLADESGREHTKLEREELSRFSTRKYRIMFPVNECGCDHHTCRTCTLYND